MRNGLPNALELTPRMLVAHMEFAQADRRRELSELLSITMAGSRGEWKAAQEQVKALAR